MADKKISALTGATTPLAGTEVLPIVQGGSTVKVSVDNVTAGRAVSTGALAVATADITLDNAYALKGKLAAGTAVSMIRRNSSNEVAIDEDGYGTKIGYSDRFNFAGGGDLTLSIGNVIFSTAGKGIDFSANTHAAGMTSELLTWYEEGTFTPTYTSTGTPPTVTYSHQYGKYTRIGRQVFFTIEIGTNSASGGTGLLAVGGLPFTAVNDRFTGTFSVGYAENFTTGAPSGGYVYANETIARLTYEVSATSKTEMLTTFLTNGAGQNYLVISGSYIV